MSKFAWWIIKIISAAAAIFGAAMVGWSSVALFYLITGKVTVYFEQPSLAGLATALIVGMVLLIGGYKAPKWLGIDRWKSQPKAAARRARNHK